MKTNTSELTEIFPKGEKGTNDLFTGNAYPTALVDADSVYNTLVGNVYFEPGARSNWHSHPAGQILIITDGIGYHQMDGQPIQVIKKGDVVEHVYEVTNTGKNPLIISAVKPGCGCTAPDYTKEPIMPGQKGQITLKFDSTNFDGVVYKSAEVYANVAQVPIEIRFSADIQP